MFITLYMFREISPNSEIATLSYLVSLNSSQYPFVPRILFVCFVLSMKGHSGCGWVSLFYAPDRTFHDVGASKLGIEEMPVVQK